MKAITVQQPWAHAIIHLGKNVENRTQAWSYRGPLAIHAGQRLSQRGLDTIGRIRDGHLWDPDDLHRGAVVGVVDLVDVHDGYCTGCCRPWGESGVGPSGYGLIHLVLANPRPVAEPIPCKGRLGLWNLPADIQEQIQ